jgi:hypothetical protein
LVGLEEKKAAISGKCLWQLLVLAWPVLLGRNRYLCWTSHLAAYCGVVCGAPRRCHSGTPRRQAERKLKLLQLSTLLSAMHSVRAGGAGDGGGGGGGVSMERETPR